MTPASGSPDDLADHRGIGWGFWRSIGGWPFKEGGETRAISPPSVIRASDGEAARALALGGGGLARLALFHVGSDIADARLIPVLEHLNPEDREDVYPVYLGQPGALPTRVRALIDFLVEHLSVDVLALRLSRQGWRLET